MIDLQINKCMEQEDYDLKDLSELVGKPKIKNGIVPFKSPLL